MGSERRREEDILCSFVWKEESDLDMLLGGRATADFVVVHRGLKFPFGSLGPGLAFS